MLFKKIGIAAAILFLAATVVIAGNQDKVRIEEIRYRCRLESYNPLWHILFFLFSSDNREFLWREKIGISDSGRLREVELFNKSRRVIRFFNQGENYEAEIIFGGEESGQLNPEQAKAWFEMWDFVRSAKVGERKDTKRLFGPPIILTPSSWKRKINVPLKFPEAVTQPFILREKSSRQPLAEPKGF